MTTDYDQTIVILGHQQLQNDLMCTLIKQSVDLPCFTATTAMDCFPGAVSSDEPAAANSTNGADKTIDQEILILCDATQSELNDILLSLSEAQKQYSFHVALFNVSKDDDLDTLASWSYVSGIFEDSCSQETFVKGIKAIFDGEVWLPRKLVTKFLRQGRTVNPSVARSSSNLTDREIQILQAMGTGAKNSDIANTLNLSPHTVKTHVYNIFKKINASNRMQAVNWAKENLL